MARGQELSAWLVRGAQKMSAPPPQCDAACNTTRYQVGVIRTSLESAGQLGEDARLKSVEKQTHDAIFSKNLSKVPNPELLFMRLTTVIRSRRSEL
jgi:hypothetical protein